MAHKPTNKNKKVGLKPTKDKHQNVQKQNTQTKKTKPNSNWKQR